MTDFFKKYKNKIILISVVLAVLTLSFFRGSEIGEVSGPLDETKISVESIAPFETPDIPVLAESESEPQKNEDLTKITENSEKQQDAAYEEIAETENTLKETRVEKKVAGGNTDSTESTPVQAQDTKSEKKVLTCTLSVRCDTVFNNLNKILPEKIELLPENGIIFPETEVVFYENESVFNILLREMKKNKIHLEFENTPIHKSSYIEGIHNLYEFDCSELSGWMYKVNGKFPNYGSSRCILQDGDKIEWVYTCDFGADVGGEYAAGKQR